MFKAMKDSGVEWIGDIPEHWEVRKTKYVLKERNEKNDPIKSDNILSLTMEQGVILYKDKKGGGNKAKEDLSAYKLAYPNDIVLNSMNVVAGSVGLSNYFGCVSPVYYMLYSDNNEISINYYDKLFQSKTFQLSLMGLGNGIMMKESSSGKLNTIRMRIPIDKLKVVLLPVPPQAEQKNIANFLDEKTSHIDSIIEKTKQSIEEFKKYKQALITETVTKGLKPEVKMKNSGIEWIGEIPEHWNVSRLRYLGNLQNGISKSRDAFGSGYPFLSYGDVYRDNELPKTVTGLIESSESERTNYSVKYGDVLFTRTSEIIEEVGLSSTCLETISDVVFAGFVIRFRPKTGELLPHFSKYYFRSQIHRSFFAKEMNLVTRASLSQPLLKKMPVLLPNIEEQKKIADFLDEKTTHIDSLIKNKVSMISQLEEYKKSMIYEYVTGKKEVE